MSAAKTIFIVFQNSQVPRHSARALKVPVAAWMPQECVKVPMMQGKRNAIFAGFRFFPLECVAEGFPFYG